MSDDPLTLAISTTVNARFNTRSFVSQLLSRHRDDTAVAFEMLKRDLSLSVSSRKVNYKEINPD